MTSKVRALGDPSSRAPSAALVLIALGLLLADIAIFSPGEINADGRSQLLQIATGRIDDWHSPAMTRLWQALLQLGFGSRPLFLLIVAAEWAGLLGLAVLLQARGRLIGAGLVLAAGVIPYFLVLAGALTKDALLYALLLLGFALILAGRTRSSRACVASGVLAVALAVLMRHNAACALGPMLLLAFAPDRLQRPVVLLAVSAVAAVVAFAASGVINHQLLGARRSQVGETLQVFDLAGIAARSGDAGVLGPSNRLSKADIAGCYTPIMWDTLSGFGRCPWFTERAGEKIVDLAKGPADAVPRQGYFAGLWLPAIARHPLAYAEHRVAHVNSALFLFVPRAHRAAYLPTAELKMTNPIASFLRYSILFSPGFLTALGLGLIVALLRFPAEQSAAPELLLGALALDAAGLLYAASFLIGGVASVERYFLFPSMASILALLVAGSDPAFRSFLGRHRGLLLVCAAIPLLALVVAGAGRLFLPVPQPLPAFEAPSA